MSLINPLLVHTPQIWPQQHGTRLYIRYMLSLRCKSIANSELIKSGIRYSILPYGAIEFHDENSKNTILELKANLLKSGMELLDVHESMLVDKIIGTIIEVIHCFDELPRLTYSEIIAKNFGETNESILKIFSEIVGLSVIQFIVIQKVERIKELLLYDDIPLSKITVLLKYKSDQHLIAQFKKSTCLTPDYYRRLKSERQKLASKFDDHTLAT